jgi:serine/threonine protein kinase
VLRETLNHQQLSLCKHPVRSQPPLQPWPCARASQQPAVATMLAAVLGRQTCGPGTGAGQPCHDSAWRSSPTDSGPGPCVALPPLLNAQHIVEFYEVFLTPSYLAVVMEYVNGTNLQHYLEARRLALRGRRPLRCTPLQRR